MLRGTAWLLVAPLAVPVAPVPAAAPMLLAFALRRTRLQRIRGERLLGLSWRLLRIGRKRCLLLRSILLLLLLRTSLLLRPALLLRPLLAALLAVVGPALTALLAVAAL
ncbi:MAG TPA: hypothetical protein VHL85_05630, partial [Burkholderiales bacterium]|nr:hypothetical protein [Burkholderiales bacterium]